MRCRQGQSDMGIVLNHFLSGRLGQSGIATSFTSGTDCSSFLLANSGSGLSRSAFMTQKRPHNRDLGMRGYTNG